MDSNKFSDKATEFSASLTESLNDGYVGTILDGLNGDEASRMDVFKGGFALGAASAYDAIMPSITGVSNLLKNLYAGLDELMKKHDDVQYLSELAELRGLIAGHVVSESEKLSEAAKRSISDKSGIPAKYIDESVLISDIPSDVINQVGTKMAVSNIRMFAIFAACGCKSWPDGRTPTMEEMIEMVKRGEVTPPSVEEARNAEYAKFIPSYGAACVRRARDAYKRVTDRLEYFRNISDSDAKTVASDFIHRVMTGTKE